MALSEARGASSRLPTRIVASVATGSLALTLLGLTVDEATASTACTTSTTTLSDDDADGFYEITSADDLVFLTENDNQPVPGDPADLKWRQKSFQLTQSIDLGGCVFDPIARKNNPFEGDFDGGGFTISNLTVSKDDGWYMSLFARLDASTVSNLTLANASISGVNWVGAIAGDMINAANISNVSLSNVTVSGTGSYVGGLVGQGQGASSASGITATNLTVSGDVYVGGLIGWQTDNGGSVSQVTATGLSVSGGYYVGGVIGGETGENSSITNVVLSNVDVEATGFFGTAGGLVGWDHGANSVISDISMTEVNVESDQRVVGGLAGNLNGVSLSNATLRSIWVGESSDDLGGLAGVLANSTISDVSIVVEVSGRFRVGGLAGTLRESDIARTVGVAEVESTLGPAGGLAGEVGGSDGSANVVEFSWVYVLLTSRGDGAGGFFGDLGAAGPFIRDSYALGSIAGQHNVGGLVGIGDPDGATVERSYSAAVVSGDSPFGLIADDDIAATNSFWDTQTSNQSASRGGTGKTTAEMTTFSTFNSAGWGIVNGWEPFDSDNGKVWGICPGVNDGYPFLLWQFSSDPCPEVAQDAPSETTEERPQRADSPAIHFDAPTPIGQEVAGTRLLAEGEGLLAGQGFSVTLNPGGVIVAQGQASTQGAFSASTVLPAGLVPGTYLLTLTTRDPAGNPLTLSQRFGINAAGEFVAPEPEQTQPEPAEAPSNSSGLESLDESEETSSNPSSTNSPTRNALPNRASDTPGPAQAPGEPRPTQDLEVIPGWLVVAASIILIGVVIGGIAVGIYRSRATRL